MSCQNEGVGLRGEDMVFRKEESDKEGIPGSQLCTESKQLTLKPAHALARQSQKEEWGVLAWTL